MELQLTDVAVMGARKTDMNNENYFIEEKKNGYRAIKSYVIWISDNDFGMFVNNSQGLIKEYLKLFEEASQKHNLTFRIYLTAHGMRAFVINKIKITSPISLLRSVNADPKYTMICSRDKKFACRVSPKTKKHYSEYSITKYLNTIGTEDIIEEVKELIDFHDYETKAFENYSLV
jgi:predicted metal-dependent hydrolase